MIEELRNRIDNLSKGAKFIVRLIYPILLYLLFHFIMHSTIGLDLQVTQFIFIILWGIVEWQLFLKKSSN